MLLAALFALAVPAGAEDLLAQASPAPPPAASPAPSPSPSATPTPKPFQMSGYLDAGYASASAAAPNGVTSGRVFDNVSGTPQLQTVNITAGYTGPIGAKFEVNAGQDANVIHSYPQALFVGSPPFNTQVDITQAYLSYSTGNFTLIGGKFETLAGAEVIESPNDLNFSRSILFGFAVPFTHTGLRLTYAATPHFSVIVGANRGWDLTYPLNSVKNGSGGLASDNNAITVEAGLAWNPSSVFSGSVQFYTGKVNDWFFVGCANTNCNRQLVDLVGTYHVNSTISVVANGDFGSQTNTALPGFVFGVPAIVSKTATWKGGAVYVSDAFTPKLTGTIRYELFEDDQGYRIFNFVGTQWTEETITAQYAVLPNLTLRVEGRFDNASQPIFANRTSFQKTNTQFGAEVIVHAP